MSEYHFVKVGNGRLALNHRPGGRDFKLLRQSGCTHVVTLLKESEFAERIGNKKKRGLAMGLASHTEWQLPRRRRA